jgi:predicted dehydrogenase
MKQIAIFGCGDFLRWQADDLKNSKNIRVAVVYDPDPVRASKWAAEFGASVADSQEAVFADPSIDMVALFVPPWIRKSQFVAAAKAGKHVLCTKPLGSTTADCEEMIAAAKEYGIRAGVIYGRTGDAFVETVKDVLEGGRFGKLALYRQDWLHAYPKWNTWATDPEKNGGPFMDAMIHNLNTASYLMGCPVVKHTFFSDNLAHPDLKCADTESMVVHYAEGGVAHLFITWAADLATHSTEGNDREHIDLFYLVTDQGWRLTKIEEEEGPCILSASKEGRNENIPCKVLESTVYDAFGAYVDGAAFPRDLAPLDAAAEDLTLVRGQG